MPIRDEDLAAIAAWRDGDTATRREAGRAIARVLRGEPLSMSYRRMLADFFDPPGMDKPDFAHGSHRVRLKTGRKKKVKDGRPPKAGPRLAAAVYRYIQVGHRKQRADSYQS